MPRLLVLLALTSVLLGCGPKNDLVGTWKGSTKGGPVVYEFNNDGTLNQTNSVDGINVTSVYTYKIEGGSLSVMQTDMRFGDGPEELVLTEKGKHILDVVKPESWPFSLVGNDKLKVKETDSPEITLTRS